MATAKWSKCAVAFNVYTFKVLHCLVVPLGVLPEHHYFCLEKLESSFTNELLEAGHKNSTVSFNVQNLF